MGNRDTGYDQTRDPRTGRPPLAADAERIKAEKINQQEGRGYAPEGQDHLADERMKPEANEDAVEVEETDEPQEFIAQRSSDGGESADVDGAAVEIAVDDLDTTDDRDSR